MVFSCLGYVFRVCMAQSLPGMFRVPGLDFTYGDMYYVENVGGVGVATLYALSYLYGIDPSALNALVATPDDTNSEDVRAVMNDKAADAEMLATLAHMQLVVTYVADKDTLFVKDLTKTVPRLSTLPRHAQAISFLRGKALASRRRVEGDDRDDGDESVDADGGDLGRFE